MAVWTVKPGREDDFVQLWTELGTRTLHDFPEAVGTLIRDRERPNRFVSFGPWPDAETAERWRSTPAFRETLEKMRELLDGFEPGMYDELIWLAQLPSGD